jgi:hypothetical protein
LTLSLGTPGNDLFKRDNKGKKEAIVEPNKSEQGSKAGKTVSLSELG